MQMSLPVNGYIQWLISAPYNETNATLPCLCHHIIWWPFEDRMWFPGCCLKATKYYSWNPGRTREMAAQQKSMITARRDTAGGRETRTCLTAMGGNCKPWMWTWLWLPLSTDSLEEPLNNLSKPSTKEATATLHERHGAGEWCRLSRAGV